MLHAIELFLSGLRTRQFADSLPEKHIDVRLCLFDAHIGFAPRDNVKRLELLVVQSLPAWRKNFLHAERDPYIWQVPHRGAEESLGSDPDDGINRRPDAHFLADDRGIA